ncbi:nucleotidyltransferase substrate binding protein [Candidatus Uhrbacteria bacterium]|nr:nucleotidyltransferase substrate binding protein [Candidatus Uhrbacteria bacterium]
MTKDEALHTQLERALAKLDEALVMQKTELVRDVSVKRFELCFDLAWKLVKGQLGRRGVSCASPRECLRLAFLNNIMKRDDMWFVMLKNRNLAVHTYNEEIAEAVYAILPNAAQRFHFLLDHLPKE